MKFLYLPFFFFFAMISCAHAQSALKQENTKVNTPDSIAVLISTIEFTMKATKEERDIFDDGIVPWMSLDHPAKYTARMIDADKIVLNYPNVTLIIDYPLAKPASFELPIPEKGMSKKDLILKISAIYHEIYKQEENTANVKTVPIGDRKKLLNRNETDGKYGISMHDLSDLDLSTVEVYKSEDGKIFLMLEVES